MADPVTGDFIFIFGFGSPTTNAELWKLNPDGAGTWTMLDGNLMAANKPCNTILVHPCPNDLFGTPISTYGALLFWKDTGATTADVWLYKVSASSPPPPPGPDTTPPTVSITAPLAGNTVSGNVMTVSATAADNVGVVGVQFKLDGNNWGAEVTSSPFSVSWDTTAIANGSHTLTAIARDAAGNSTTSTPVSVSVSNSVSSVTPPPTGSDFQTRCAQPGVIRCVGLRSGARHCKHSVGSEYRHRY